MTMYQWLDAGNTILQVETSPNTYRIVEAGNPDWPTLSQRDDIAPYVSPPEPTPEEILAAERAAMICTPAQMRLALHRMGLLAQVQAIADSDAEASIVWEYATQIMRNDPFIDVLGVDAFTPDQIDDIFREAMKL